MVIKFLTQKRSDIVEQEIELREIIAVLINRWKIILALFILAVLASAYSSYYRTPSVYQASTTLLVGKPVEGSQVVIQDVQLNRQMVSTYEEIARSTTVATAVIEELNLRMSPGELKSKVSVSQVGNTEIISISVTDSSPDRAAFLANGVANVFIVQLSRIMHVDNISIIDAATTPSSPINTRPRQNIAVAAILSLMVGVFAAFLLEFMDNTIKTPQDIERHLGLPFLGTIPLYEGE
jgi:capsular polysaccharide biosynthesis protein